jgi:hypothetical protein
MRGRSKGQGERIILLAHTSEGFARKKILKPAEHYLKPRREAKPPPSAVATMLSRMEKAGLAVSVRRIPATERKAYGRDDSRLP